MSGAARGYDLEEQLIRMVRALEQSEKFSEEQRKLWAEARKLDAENLKLRRDPELAPWQIVVTAMGTGAALFAAGAASLKLLQVH